MSRSFPATSASQILANSGLPFVLGMEQRLKTVMCWARQDSGASTGTAVGCGDSSDSGYLALGVTGENKAFYETSAGGDSFGGTLTPETWGLVIGQIETGNNAHCSLNGVLSLEATGTHEELLTVFSIGCLELAGNVISHFKGEIAEVAVWEGNLTKLQEEELAAKKNPTKVNAEKLVGYWRLNGSGSTEPSYEGLGPTLTVGADVGVGPHSPEIEPPGEEVVVQELAATCTGTASASTKLHSGQRMAATATGTATASAKVRAGQRLAAVATGRATLAAKSRVGQRLGASLSGHGNLVAAARLRQTLKARLYGHGNLNVAIVGPVVESTYAGLSGESTFADTPGSTYAGLGGDSDYGA